MHGLLLPSASNATLANALVAAGHEVILLDLLGHGRSEQPQAITAYRLEYAAEQVVALLDHLGLDSAVIGGMSLGANVTMQVALDFPDRIDAAILEMPVLERGTMGVILTLTPMFVAFKLARRPLDLLMRATPKLPGLRGTMRDTLEGIARPEVMADVLQGFISGPVCPTGAVRRTIEVPALVIGHGRDWIHPLDDAVQLAGELPNARFVEALSPIEARRHPERLAAEISGFVGASGRRLVAVAS